MTALATSPLPPAGCCRVSDRPPPPRSLAAASDSVRTGHRLPFPSGGSGGGG